MPIILITVGYAKKSSGRNAIKQKNHHKGLRGTQSRKLAGVFSQIDWNERAFIIRQIFSDKNTFPAIWTGEWTKANGR